MAMVVVQQQSVLNVSNKSLHPTFIITRLKLQFEFQNHHCKGRIPQSKKTDQSSVCWSEVEWSLYTALVAIWESSLVNRNSEVYLGRGILPASNQQHFHEVFERFVHQPNHCPGGAHKCFRCLVVQSQFKGIHWNKICLKVGYPYHGWFQYSQDMDAFGQHHVTMCRRCLIFVWI